MGVDVHDHARLDPERARRVDARHLVGTGQGHILLTRGCMPRLAGEFVEDLDLAALDASCLAPLSTLPFFIDYVGAEP